MKKIMEIEGMHCEKCKAKVEKALNSLDGAKAKVDLAKKSATVSLANDLGDDVLKNTVESLGFKVVKISEKKGLFGRA